MLAADVAGWTDHRLALADGVARHLASATGDWGARTQIEASATTAYGTVAGTLEALAVDRSRDRAAVRERVAGIDRELQDVQHETVGESTAAATEASLLAARCGDVQVLAAAGEEDAAETLAWLVRGRFENGPLADEAEEFGASLGTLVTAANREADAIEDRAERALGDGLETTERLAGDDATAAVARLAALEARCWDAATLAAVGGPGTAAAHAAVLTGYRLRLHDAAWLAEQGATDAAELAVRDLFAEFEAAAAHDALEAADEDAYHGFEDGLEAAVDALASGDDPTPDLETADEHLLAGVEALVGPGLAALHESAYFRGRLEDARRTERIDEGQAAAAVVRDLFARFEANEGDLHERFEETDHDAYEAFEADLEAAIDALEAGDALAGDALDRAQESLFELEQRVGSTAAVCTAEAAFLIGRAADAAAVADRGDALAETADPTGEPSGSADPTDAATADDERERARELLQSSLARFEADAAGFHETLELADHDAYEAFEDALEAAIEAAAAGGDVHDAALAFYDEAATAALAVSGRGAGEGATALLEAAREQFAAGPVPERLETADAGAADELTAALAAYEQALRDDEEVDRHVAAVADAARSARFAVVGARSAEPSEPVAVTGDDRAHPDTSDSDGHDHSDDHDDQWEDYEGGPDVVEAVPEDVDHVVDVLAASFDPPELTISHGDTVAWVHAAGEPHTVTAYEDGLPADAPYWASGGFESEADAEAGWEDGRGALVPGTAYVRTFETTGRHEYYCIPHEAAGQVGTIVVE